MKRLGVFAGVVVAGGALAGLAGPALAAAPRLLIRDAAVSVVVLPEERSDIAVEVWRPNARLPIQVRRVGSDVVIAGNLPRFLTNCHGSGDGLRVFVLGRGDFGVGEMPQVLVRAPLDTVIDSGGVVRGAVARSHSLTLDAGGCGGWTVANVAGPLTATVSGVGDLKAGAADTATLTLSGAGRLSVGQVRTQVTAHLSGTGSLTVGAAGAGELSISGSGGLSTGPIAGPLSVRVSGAGGLKTQSVAGPVRAEVSGVGNVQIAGGHTPSLNARVSGAGNVVFRGVADTLDANLSGVGGIDVARVTGAVSQHVSGVGQVRIGDR